MTATNYSEQARRMAETVELPEPVAYGAMDDYGNYEVSRNPICANGDRLLPETQVREAIAAALVRQAEDTRQRDRWDDTSQGFKDWWNDDYDDSTNPFRLHSAAYWAWAGWGAALMKLTQEQEPVALLQNGILVSSSLPVGYTGPLYTHPTPSQHDERLQEFAVEHGPAWAQGIGLLDAAHIMAGQPTEGVDHEMGDAAAKPETQEERTRRQGAAMPIQKLPDGSAFGSLSLPLPENHWLYAPNEYVGNSIDPVDLPSPCLERTPDNYERAKLAIRYAIRGATCCGKEPDFDPDALVQNALYALLGPYPQQIMKEQPK